MTQAPSYSMPAPDYSQQTAQMAYSSFMGGGYKSMNCGYGYSKASDQSCQTQAWVSAIFFPLPVTSTHALRMQYQQQSGCYETIIINKYVYLADPVCLLSILTTVRLQQTNVFRCRCCCRRNCYGHSHHDGDHAKHGHPDYG